MLPNSANPSTTRRAARQALAIGITLCAVAAASSAMAQAEAPATRLPAGSIQSQANGRIELQADAHSPLYVEFDRSPTLTKALAGALRAKGLGITADRGTAKATLSIRGDLVLLGGPVFHKGVKVAMGEATEKALVAAVENRTMTSGEATQTVTTVALEGAAYKFAVSPFWGGLALSRMGEVLGDATGMRGAFNKALTGDPRGICLSRCDEWNRVKQSAYAFVTFSGPDGKQEIRVLATAVSDTLAPEEVVVEALARALSSIELGPVSAPTK